jgi:hypothetical protein
MSHAMRFLVLSLCLAACGTDNADVVGDYTITLTNRDNGCNLGNWTAGASSAAAVTLTQTKNAVSATVTGLGAVVLEVAIGGHIYDGTVDGNSLDLTLFGTRSNSMGNCTFTFNSEIHATIDGDVLTGEIDYLSATNGNPDCAAIATCRSLQNFNGTRPPR